MTETPAGNCASCQKLKAHLKPRKSQLLPNTVLLLCTDCFAAKMEPRFAIILAARTDLDTAAEYIRNKRYVGDAITARELV